MHKNPKFSIIIPVYNVEKQLPYCIESVINQTLQDIEIICVNDGSTDNSLSILYNAASKDTRIHVIDKDNGGISTARNAGLKIATGDYILFVDSDDCLKKNACDRLFMEVTNTGAEVIKFGTELFPKYIVEKSIKYKILETELQVSPRQYKGNCIKALFKEKASYPYVWNGCYSRRFLAKNKLNFDDELRFGEDMLFLFQVFPNVSNIVYIPDKLYQYRCDRKGSLMEEAEKNKVWKIQMHIEIIRKILKYWQEKEIIEGNMDELYKLCIKFFLEQFNIDNAAKYYVAELASDYVQLLQEYGLHFTKKVNSGRKLERELKKYAVF